MSTSSPSFSSRSRILRIAIISVDQMFGHTFPILRTWQIDEQSSRQSPQNSIVQVERPVCGSNHNDSLVLVDASGAEPVHFLHELCQDLIVSLVSEAATPGGSRSEQCIDLVQEDDARRQTTCQGEDGFHTIVKRSNLV
jgi:hypothetical protein